MPGNEEKEKEKRMILPSLDIVMLHIQYWGEGVLII